MAIELILKSLFFFSAFQLHEAHVKSALGWEKSPKQQKILGKEKKNKKIKPLTAFTGTCWPWDWDFNRIKAQGHKEFPLLHVPSSACSLSLGYLQHPLLPLDCFPYISAVSTLKELTSLSQMRSLQVSTPWKQIGPKGRHILIMRERLRGGEKRSQHEV